VNGRSSGVTAVVPLRDGRGKTRLAPVLGDDQRRRVVAALARHVVSTLLRVEQITGLLVVTSDREFVAATLGELLDRVVVVEQPVDRPGLDAAADLGRERASAGRLLVIHADLPLLTPDDLRALLAHCAPVVLGTDRPGTGTSVVALTSDARGVRFAFGSGSLRAHLAEADRLGVAAGVVRRSGTQTDLDTQEDWVALADEVRQRLVS